MLSDELQPKPELLVEFVQNASIPLGEESLSLLPDTPQCGPLLLPEAPVAQRMPCKVPSPALLNSLQVDIDSSTDSREDKSAALLSPTEPSSLLQDLPSSDNSSFILLNLARSGLGSPPEHLVFVQDEAEDAGNDFLSNDCADSSMPWFLRVQELAHDSLIAATRAQLAKTAKGGSNETSLNAIPDAEPKAAQPEKSSEKRLHCSYEGCERSFLRPTHLKYHLKTHRNDRSLTCPADGCKKSFYGQQRLKVHMRSHTGEQPLPCAEPGCRKQSTTVGIPKNHLGIHPGQKPFPTEIEGCGPKPEMLVEFVQNASIPLGEDSLSLLPDTPECGPLLLPEAPVAQRMPCKVPSPALLNSLQVDIDSSTDSRVDKSAALLSPTEPSSLLQDLPSSDNSSFILLNLARSGLGSPPEHLVFVQDEAEDTGNDFLSNDCADSSTPWFLRVQELAHDSLIAATRAQLAKTAKGGSNAETLLSAIPDAEPKAAQPEKTSEKRLHCSYEGCERSFLRPTHLKYHLKTHRNDRSFICQAEGCGKSFYVLQRLKVHMRTHNGERPFACPEPGCGKQFTTAGNLKNHLRTHTGEKPFLCEMEGCGRSFAEYSSLRKHLVVHSGVKSHQCQVCGKSFSQSGSRNAHVRKRHGRKLEENSSLEEHLPLSNDALQGSHLLSVPSERHCYEEDVSILLS
ncbi:zinc finger protein 410 [Gastrophryne carolinensis]